jgi:hypothetical protein
MKTFNENAFKYVGVWCGKHVFVDIVHNDPELVLVRMARYAKMDGSSKYFDPVSKDISTITADQLIQASVRAN